MTAMKVPPLVRLQMHVTVVGVAGLSMRQPSHVFSAPPPLWQASVPSTLARHSLSGIVVAPPPHVAASVRWLSTRWGVGARVCEPASERGRQASVGGGAGAWEHEKDKREQCGEKLHGRYVSMYVCGRLALRCLVSRLLYRATRSPVCITHDAGVPSWRAPPFCPVKRFRIGGGAPLGSECKRQVSPAPDDPPFHRRCDTTPIAPVQLE